VIGSSLWFEKVNLLSWPKVYVLILTWNRVHDVITCLSHLDDLDYPNYEVLVIDNGSSDGTVETIKEKFEHIDILENGINLGYAGGNNAGLRHALEHGADYMFIVNSDTILPPDIVREMVEVASSSQDIAAVGAKNLKMSDPSTIWAAYLEMTYDWTLVKVVGNREQDGPEYTVVQDVDSVVGCGMLLSRRAIQDVGMIDEFLFGYHEDVDWCLRARRKGYRCVYAGTAYLLHRGSSSTDISQEQSMPARYFLVRNAIIVARRYGNPLQFAHVCLSMLLFLSGKEMKCQLGLRKRGTFSLMWRGFRDGWRERPAPLRELGLR